MSVGQNRPIEPRRVLTAVILLILAAFSLSACGEEDEPPGLGKRIIPIGQSAPKGGGRYQVGQPYEINGVTYEPREDSSYDRTGTASWYGSLFHGRHTANGEIFDMERLSAAHPTLPLPIYVEVTNLDNRRRAVLRVNDRGPFRDGREIDLSRKAAEILGFKRAGTAAVRVRYLKRAPLDGDDSLERSYLGKRGYSEFAAKTEDEEGPEVVIAVGPPGPPPRPPLPDRPDRSVFAEAEEVQTDSAPELDKVAILVALERAQAAQAVSSGEQPQASDATPALEAPGVADAAQDEGWDDAADDALAVEGSAEMTSSIVLPASAPSVPDNGSMFESSATQGPMIQAGSFRDPANAERARAALFGVAPVDVTRVTDQGQTLYRVRVGPFADGIAAASALSEVAKAGYHGAKIIFRN